ncbi:hypothetical protein BC941DRAFT_424335 [Chlamydoabsidia padenii]|nr:hypothetical protein BC941DRAFT_424335 [Chlamydoabsidia padenii]
MSSSMSNQHDLHQQPPTQPRTTRLLPDSLTKRKKIFSFLSERNTRTWTSSNAIPFTTPVCTNDIKLIPAKIVKTLEMVPPLAQAYLGNTDINFLQKSLSRFQNKIKQRQDILKQQILPWFRNKQQQALLSLSSQPETYLDQTRSILLRWWGTLLGYVQHIDHNERSLYFDCILEILARSEFILYDQTDSTFDEWYSSVEGKTMATRSLLEEYKRLLVSTLRYAIEKLNHKAIYSNMISFCAKILAIGFIKIPGLAVSLIQILPVRNTIIRRLVIEMGDLKNHDTYKTRLSSIFPAHLEPMMTWNLTRYKQHICKTNQQQKSPMILSGNWIRRWKSDDSELFFSFYRHYHTIIKTYIMAGYPSTHKYSLHQTNTMLAVSPGYMYFASYFAGKIDSLLHRRLHSVTTTVSSVDKNSTNIYSTNTTSPAPPDKEQPTDINAVFPKPGEDGISVSRTQQQPRLLPSQHPANITLLSQPIGKPRPLEMATLRYTECLVSCSFMTEPSGLFHNMINVWIRTMVKTTNMMAVESVFCLLDFIETVIHGYQQTQNNAQPIYNNQRTSPLDIPFLLYTLKIMLLQSDHSITLLRALSFIYVHFDFLVSEPALMDYMCNRILLFSPIFERLFLHWSRHVRIFFARCMVWRIGRVWKTAHVNWLPFTQLPSLLKDTSSKSIIILGKVCDGNECWKAWYQTTDESKKDEDHFNYDRSTLSAHILLETMLNSFRHRYLELNQQTPENPELDPTPNHHNSYNDQHLCLPYTPLTVDSSDDSSKNDSTKDGKRTVEQHQPYSTSVRRRKSSVFKKKGHLSAHSRTSITTAKKNKWMKLFSFSSSLTKTPTPSCDNDPPSTEHSKPTYDQVFYYTIPDMYTWKAPTSLQINKARLDAADNQVYVNGISPEDNTSSAHEDGGTPDTSSSFTTLPTTCVQSAKSWQYPTSHHVYAAKAVMELYTILHEYSIWADKISITKMLVQDRKSQVNESNDDGDDNIFIMDVPGLTLDWPKNWSYSQF